MKNPNHAERESHANRFVLSWLLKHKYKEILERELQRITRQANGNAVYEYYTVAAKLTMKLKVWQKCLDYVK